MIIIITTNLIIYHLLYLFSILGQSRNNYTRRKHTYFDWLRSLLQLGHVLRFSNYVQLKQKYELIASTVWQQTAVYNTCKFSQLFDLLMSFRHIFCRISLAKCSLKLVFDPFILLFSFVIDFFFSNVSRSRICFRMPTSSSSTLCWIPLEVSINLQSLETAKAFPSEWMELIKYKNWLFSYHLKLLP